MRKDKATNLPAKRARPHNGWITQAVRSTRHGKGKLISQKRNEKKLNIEIQRLTKG